MAAAASLLVSAASRLVLQCQAKANYPGQDSTPILSLQSRSWTQLPQFSVASSSMSWRGLFLFCSSYFVCWFWCEWVWDYSSFNCSCTKRERRPSFLFCMHRCCSPSRWFRHKFSWPSFRRGQPLFLPLPTSHCFFSFKFFYLLTPLFFFNYYLPPSRLSPDLMRSSQSSC